MKSQLIFESESYQMIDACLEGYREKGCGFLEPVYQECMKMELRLRGIPFIPQKPLALEYKGCPLRAKYKPDFRQSERPSEGKSVEIAAFGTSSI